MDWRYDRKSPGRPCRLSDAQLESLDKDIEKNPEESDFHRTTWTARLVIPHTNQMMMTLKVRLQCTIPDSIFFCMESIDELIDIFSTPQTIFLIL